MDISFVTVLKLFYLIYSSLLTLTAGDDLGKCADSHCSVPIGLGVVTLQYNAVEIDKIDLISGEQVEIFVRDYGRKKELIGVKANGRMGFVPKTFVRETSVKVPVSNLVPAAFKFGHNQENPNLVTGQEQLSQLSHQDALNPHTAINTEASMQNYLASQESPSGSSNNFQAYTSQFEQPLSTGGYIDPQFGSNNQQQASIDPTNNPQVSNPRPTDIHQQFSDLSKVQFPQYQGELNSLPLQPSSSFVDNFQLQPGSSFSNNFQQQPGSSFSDNFQQQAGSERVDIAQQPVVSALPNHDPAILNTQSHQLYSTLVQQAIHSQLNPHQQQFQQFDSGSPQHQQHLDYHRASLSSSHPVKPPDDSFSTRSSNVEENRGNSFFTSPQINSALPNEAPEVNQWDSLGKDVKEQINFPSNSYYGNQNENNQYQDTANLLRDQGYDYEDYVNEDSTSYDLSKNQGFGYNGYHQGYSPESSIPHHYTQPSNGLFHPNKLHPNLDSKADNTPGTFQQEPNQKSVLDSLGPTTSLKPSFHATSSQLTAEHPNVNTGHTSNTMESLKSDISERSKEIDKIDEEDSDEGEVDVESVDSDVEILHDNNKETKNVVESDSNIKIDLNSKQVEVPNIEAESQSVNLVLPSTTQTAPEPSITNNINDSSTHTNAHEQSIEAQVTTHVPHINDSNEVNVAKSELNSVNDAKLSNSEVHTNSASNQNVNSELSSEEQNSISDEIESHIANFDNDIKASDATPSQNVLDPPSDVHMNDFATEDHEENFNEEHNSVDEIEKTTQTPNEKEMNNSLSVLTENESTVSEEPQLEVNNNLNAQEVALKDEINFVANITEEEHVNAADFLFDGSEEISTTTSVNGTDIVLDKEQEDNDQPMNISETSEAEGNVYLNNYQIRNLKEDQEGSENVESSDELNENGTYPEEDEYSMIENSLEAIRSFIETLLPWIPEPLYSTVMDLEKKGISPRVPVFTALSALPCILLIVAIVFIKEKSQEKVLTVQLAIKEKHIFTLSAEKVALEEKLEKTTDEFESSKNMLGDERKTFDSMKKEVDSLKQQIEKANLELENTADEINTLKEREKEFMELIKDHEKIHLDLMEEKSAVDKKVADQEDYINTLSDQVDEKENEITLLQTEVEKYKQSNDDYEEKVNQLQTNCNQLLKEAEVWNMRVNELNSKLSEESSAKEELENTLELKESEVKSLTHLVQTLKSFEDIDSGNEDEQKSSEEKLKCLMDSSKVLIELQKKEEENSILSTKLSEAKNKILEIEVDVHESKSEIDKLKLNYNQALQDKAEATTKLEVLTTYFKDKELMLQKQLGAQEAFREKREKDADSAERQIVLIEKENASYKYQVASMKQEMEETERNLKTQIATQEKKAHENWIAARAAERKLEDMKQEVTQLRQRLTLLEREQENWANSSRDEIIRPIPKRISGMNDDPSHVPDMNNSLDPRHMFPPPPPMMLPPDRPLPPLPPLPPFLPPLEPPPFRPQPWHLPSESGSDFRMTPPDFMRRELTPPRGRHSAIIDGDMGPLQSSPLGGDMRESRNSTPPHNLPSFHDIPPPPPRPFFPPPPGHHPRYPQPPAFRREFAPGHKRIDNQSDSLTGRGTQPTPSSQEHYPHNSRA